MKRWMLSTDGGVTYDREVYPIKPVRYSWERDLNAGQIFFRQKLSTPLVFAGDDYRYFRGFERTNVRRCDRFFIRQERLCEKRWVVRWTGSFSVTGGWDHDACEFTVTPRVEDRFTCFMEALERKVNLLAPPGQTVTATIVTTLEFATIFVQPILNPTTWSCDVDADYEDQGWVVGYTHIIGLSEILGILWREVATTDCVGGIPVPPPGTGWVLAENNCALNGTAKYARPPVITWPYGAPTQGTCVGGVSQQPDSPECASWLMIRGCGSCPIIFGGGGDNPDLLDYGTWYICLDGDTRVKYADRGRPLQVVLEYMLERAECDDITLASDFFEINPVGDAPGYVPGRNYVTGATNQYDEIFVLHESDVADPGATNPATKLERSWKEMFALFLAMARLYWTIDSDGRLRIEHWSFYSFAVGLDTTASPQDRALNRGNSRYTYLSEDVPKYERLTFSEAQGPDFVGKDIIYSGPCVGIDQKAEETQAEVTTDISFINSNPDQANKDGLVLVATEAANVINDVGALSLTVATNAPMSKANLQDRFWRHDRYLLNGNMNAVDQTFEGVRPNIQQTGVRAQFCCELEGWDANEGVITELGTRILAGRAGYVERAELDDDNDLLTITLRYAR